MIEREGENRSLLLAQDRHRISMQLPDPDCSGLFLAGTARFRSVWSPAIGYARGMDKSVLAALRKWPNVPAAYGWLALDRRGAWFLQGEPILHRRLIAFINRNYLADESGAWYFQNGPQKAYVTLAYTPWIWHHPRDEATMAGDGLSALSSHTGEQATSLKGAWIDEQGNLLLETELGIGLLDDRDLEPCTSALCQPDGTPLPENNLAEAIERLMTGQQASLGFRLGTSIVPVCPIRSTEVPGYFGFVQDPKPPAS